MAAPDTTLTARYEYKYLVPEERVEAVRRALAVPTRPDSFAAGRAGGSYPIHTLYLDTGGLDCYRATADGHKTRFKLRVRLYEEDADAPAWTEIKRRLDQWIRKHRARVDRRLAAATAAGRLGFPQGEERLEGEGDPAFVEFRNLALLLGARPVAWVGYVREPRIGPGRQPVRISLDRDLCWAPPREGLQQPPAADWSPVPLGAQILEIKFTGLFPSWAAALVRALDLERVSVCKYALAVEAATAQGLLPWITPPVAC